MLFESNPVEMDISIFISTLYISKQALSCSVVTVNDEHTKRKRRSSKESVGVKFK